MNQGSGNGEIQRTLAADDVAAIRYGFSGVDETEGTADDYDLVLNYVGVSSTADIVIKFDNSETGFAVSQNGGTFVGPDHVTLGSSRIFFNTNFQWFFNQTLSVADNDFIDGSLFIYPNPATNSIVISNPKLLRLNAIKVYDINGRLIQENQLNSSNLFDKTELDISAMSNGIYLLVIDAEGGQFTKRIVKE